MANQLTTFQDLLPLISTKKSAIEFAIRHNLIAKSIYCPGGHQILVKASNEFFRCRRQPCNFRKSIFYNTWFSNSNLTMTQNVQILYWWSMKVNQKLISHEVKLISRHTILNHCMILREVILGDERQTDRRVWKSS
jgi:hypothetical protein